MQSFCEGTLSEIDELPDQDWRRGPRNEYWEQLLAVHPKGYVWPMESREQAEAVRSALYTMTYRYGGKVRTRIAQKRGCWQLYAQFAETPTKPPYALEE